MTIGSTASNTTLSSTKPKCAASSISIALIFVSPRMASELLGNPSISVPFFSLMSRSFELPSLYKFAANDNFEDRNTYVSGAVNYGGPSHVYQEATGAMVMNQRLSERNQEYKFSYNSEISWSLSSKYSIDKFENLYPDTLSNGQKKKMNLFRCLIPKYEIYLLDEPENGLDDKSKKDLDNKLIELSKNSTIIYTSHNIGLLSIYDKTSKEIKL